MATRTIANKKNLRMFLLAKKQAKCKFCALPEVVKRQVATRDPRVTLPFILEWLKKEWGVTITRAEYKTHCSEGHAWLRPRKR